MCCGCGDLWKDLCVADDLGEYCSADCQALRAKRSGTNVPKSIGCGFCGDGFVTRKWKSVKYCSLIARWVLTGLLLGSALGLSGRRLGLQRFGSAVSVVAIWCSQFLTRVSINTMTIAR